jgi:hypothetical protein
MFPVTDIQKILAELDSLAQTYWGARLDPETEEGFENMGRFHDEGQEKIGAKFQELRAITGNWSQTTWKECREKHPELEKTLRIGLEVAAGPRAD